MTFRLSLAAVLAASLAASAAMAEPAPAKPAPAPKAGTVVKPGLGALTAQEPAPAAKFKRKRRGSGSDGLLPLVSATPSADGKPADGAAGRPAARPKSPPPPTPPKRGRREVKLSR